MSYDSDILFSVAFLTHESTYKQYLTVEAGGATLLIYSFLV